jgi:hypothetical protein
MKHKTLLMVISCNKNSYLWDKLLKNMNYKNILILVGNPNQSSLYEYSNNILYIKINDTYDSLQLKVLYGLNYINNEYEEYTHVLKLDDHDTLMTNSFYIYNQENINFTDFCGKKLTNINKKKFRKDYHIGKVKPGCYWDNLEYHGNFEYNFFYGGESYVLSIHSIEIILKYVNNIYGSIANIYYDFIYEDQMIGHILAINNILPVKVKYKIQLGQWYKLEFVHIPKTAGTSIEDLGNLYNYKWGRHFKNYAITKPIKGVSSWHNHNFKKENEKTYFTIVRNPYDRIISSYKYRLLYNWSQLKVINDITFSPEGFYKYIDIITDIYQLNNNVINNHILPQYKFVYNYKPKKNKYAKKVDHVIKLEDNLKGQLKILFKKYNTGINVDDLSYNNKSFKLLTKYDLNQKYLDKIYDFYETDFIKFKYNKLILPVIYINCICFDTKPERLIEFFDYYKNIIKVDKIIINDINTKNNEDINKNICNQFNVTYFKVNIETITTDMEILILEKSLQYVSSLETNLEKVWIINLKINDFIYFDNLNIKKYIYQQNNYNVIRILNRKFQVNDNEYILEQINNNYVINNEYNEYIDIYNMSYVKMNNYQGWHNNTSLPDKGFIENPDNVVVKSYQIIENKDNNIDKSLDNINNNNNMVDKWKYCIRNSIKKIGCVLPSDINNMEDILPNYESITIIYNLNYIDDLFDKIETLYLCDSFIDMFLIITNLSYKINNTLNKLKYNKNKSFLNIIHNILFDKISDKTFIVLMIKPYMILTRKHAEILINTKNKYYTFFNNIKTKYDIDIMELYIGTVLYNELSYDEFYLEMDFIELDDYF